MATTDSSGSATAERDLMNDPAYATNIQDRSKTQEDPDTCRICRGEGTKEEPLFYPCKCSGSIKFVHQNCLMEWLSHSQKKHCELCKTPFTFTKLYHPHMPQTLPTPVFLRQVLIHSFRSLLTWLRFILVAFVWLGWLPWTMRVVWRGLFWLGDGGWVDSYAIDVESTLATQERLATLAANGTSPDTHSMPLTKEAAASAFVSGVANLIPHMLSPISQTLNFTAGEPTVYKLTKSFILHSFKRFTTPLMSTSLYTAANVTDNMKLKQRHQSWLSNVAFLKTLSRSQFLNDLLIDVLEGQLITLFVVITFVLIFLIREWVVQQQVNLGARPNAEAAAGGADVRGALQQALEAQPGPEHPNRVLDGGAPNGLFNELGMAEGAVNQHPRVIARPRPRRRVPSPPAEHQLQPGYGPSEVLQPRTQSQTTDEQTTIFGDRLPEGEIFRFGSSSESGEPSSHGRPTIPTKTALAKAAEFQRTIEEENRASGKPDWPGLQVFMDLWERAGSKPEQVLRIIEDEDRAAELKWVVSAMKRLQNASISSDLPRFEVQASARGGEGSADEHNSVGSSQSWEDITRPSISEPSINSVEKLQSFAVAQLANDASELESSAKDEYVHLSNPTVTQQTEDPSSKGKERLVTPATQKSHEWSYDTTDGSKPGHPRSPKGDHNIRKTERGNSSAAFDNSPEHYDTFAGSAGPGDSTINGFVDIMNSRKTREPVQHSSEEIAFGDLQPGHASSQDGSVGALALDDSPTAEEDARPPIPQRQPATDEGAAATHGLTDRVVAWLWGGAAADGQEQELRQEMLGQNNEEVVHNIADEAPFVPIIHGQIVAQDPEGAENPALNDGEEVGPEPNDQNAIEEGEDLEGVMELIGMQGPLAGLLQNGMFSAALISTTVAAGIWLPYIWGKMVLLFLANPVSMMVRVPLRWLSATADTIVDVCIFLVGSLVYWIDTGFRLFLVPLGMVFPSIAGLAHYSALATAARQVAEGGLERLAKKVVATSSDLAEAEFPVFSIVSHEALHSTEAHLVEAFRFLFYVLPSSLTTSMGQTLRSPPSIESLKKTVLLGASKFPASMAGKMSTAIGYAHSILRIKPLSITLDYPRRTLPLDYSLAYWDSKDRFITILLGYAFFATAGFIYLKLSGSLTKARHGEKVAGAVAETLQQAGGVVKVILIISIEMIVFPLYCGLLLDVALLPLFKNVTVLSRVTFTLHSPSTSLFVHWFVGTCYMFHFALFVSMCRKIMRSGVLYFIRDPDDPTFHPVRDVLERNVSTQLRKIAFSALVYGALVIVCLGGVVWGLSYTCEGVLPIQWSSNEPVLEFPVDLLFYNFLMPLAVKFFRPSEGLHTMYSWWFRRCARLLRLSHFLFGERQEDEEGHYVRRTWLEVIARKQGNVHKLVLDDGWILAEDRNVATNFLRDGTYVRAPASDQVRIPKGEKTFLEVTDEDVRVDGQPDPNDGLHGRDTEMFTKVYIPPIFKIRIGLFIVLIWIFAATTGVGMTIVPLVFGRMVFAYLLPNHVRMNDVYAFSIGICALGGTLYTTLHFRTAFDSTRATVRSYASSHQLLHKVYTYTVRLIRLLYTYAAFAFVLPSLSALVMEFYVIIPLHTYFGAGERHIIYFIQDWTLGVLYIKMAGRLILWYSTSRPAQALRAVVRQGWLNPDVGLATRGFILPASALMIAGLLLPLPLGWMANNTFYRGAGDITQRDVYQYSYPVVLAVALCLGGVYILYSALKGWKRRIRDEVYLIGERLHNFGEKRAGGVRTSPRVTVQD